MSGVSNEIVVDVPEGCGPPAPPGNFRFTRTGRTVTLAWDVAGGATSYLVEVGSAPGLSNLLLTDLGSSTSVTAAAPPGTYYVCLRALNACGRAGAASNEIIVGVP